jgi:hypothetical protein
MAKLIMFIRTDYLHKNNGGGLLMQYDHQFRKWRHDALMLPL